MIMTAATTTAAIMIAATLVTAALLACKGLFEGEKKPRFHKMSGKAKKSFVRARLPIKIWKNLIK